MRTSGCCEGISIVAVSYSENAFENLRQYAERHCTDDARRAIAEFLDEFAQNISNKETLHFGSVHFIQKLPEQQQPVVRALIQDIPVQMLLWRYDLLRMISNTPPVNLNARLLLEMYWLSGIYRVDPEVSNIAARLVVSVLTQWDLMCLLHHQIDNALQALSSSRDTTTKSNPVLKRLGRIVNFLGWVPYQWSEEVLLDLHHKVSIKSDMEHLRFWITVMRSLFCKPLLHEKTVRKVCDEIMEHFDGKVPRDLRRYLLGCLMSGGSNTWSFLKHRVLSHPDQYLNAFFLNAMANIDKLETEKFISENHERVIASIGIEEYVRLSANIGQWDVLLADRLEKLWEDADKRLKQLIINEILDFRWENACSFLHKIVDKESDLVLKIRILEGCVTLDSLQTLIEIVQKSDSLSPVLLFHVIELCYHRLLENPRNLLHIGDPSLFAYFETARKKIYTMYLSCMTFDKLVTAMIACHDRQDVKAEFHYNTPKVQQIRKEMEKHTHFLEDLVVLLESVSNARPNITHNIFGHDRERCFTGDILTRDTILMLKKSAEVLFPVEFLVDARERCKNSMKVIQEYFLFKEWFVRPAPFVLHESIGNLIQDIRAGKRLTFIPGYFINKRNHSELKRLFWIFYECSRHGIYLTDVLLDYLCQFPDEEISQRITSELTKRRTLMAHEELIYLPQDKLEKHIEFTTFAHTYRYGKESISRPPLDYLWLKFLEASKQLNHISDKDQWPDLPPHEEMPSIIGPRAADMYRQHIDDAEKLFAFVSRVYDKYKVSGISLRVIPNLTYGLFGVSPILSKLLTSGVHVSFAGISSRYCDDINISEYSYRPESSFPVKPYLFSTASNYGTLNHDRILIVVDGTMEPIDRLESDKVRLPKSHRGYINHLVAINYIRSKFAYGMAHPERDIASAMNLSVRYVQNIIRVPQFKHLVNNLLINFDKDELFRFHTAIGSGNTYYTFAQWNPDGLKTNIGSRGDVPLEIPCLQAADLNAPALIFVSMNGVLGPGKVPAYFDNNPEVEKSRIILGPSGVWLDAGWPHKSQGIIIDFPEGEN